MWPAALATSAAAAAAGGGSLWAGGSAYMAMDLAAPASSCELVASAPGRAPLILSAVRPSEKRVAWIWTVPARARTASWQVSAMCGSSSLSAAYLVHGKRRSSVLSIARQVRVFQSGGAFPAGPALQLGVEQTLAMNWWVRTATTILSQFHTGIAVGQCTDYVVARRPDVVENVDTWAYTRFLVARGGPLGVDWTAKNWVINAHGAGLATGQIPEAGAVMVFQPGAYGAYSAGHVALVNSVRSDGSFTISEMHAPVVGQLSTRNFSAAAALAMMSNARIGFIYR